MARQVVEPVELTQEGNRIYDCPVCGQPHSVEIQADVFYGQCSHCSAALVDYKPLPHQVAFHKSKAQYKLNIGGLT